MSEGGRLGPWEIGRVLGTGETSSVHIGTHRDDPSRLAAIKILGRPDPEAVARFRREADILASLDHPHIVRVQGLDLEEELPYLEMEHIAGSSAADTLIDGPLPMGRALAVVEQLLDALGYLHARGIAHRDVRPSNLILDGQRTVLIDFGLAQSAREPGPELGGRVGSAVYAPPEWIGATAVDGVGWDLYAAGVVLHELVTGQPPFPAPDAPAEHLRTARVMAAKRELPALDPGPAFPEDLRALIRDLTAHNPAARIRSAQAARDRLRALVLPAVEPTPPEPPPTALSPRFHVTSGAWTAVVALAAVGAVGVMVALAWRLWS